MHTVLVNNKHYIVANAGTIYDELEKQNLVLSHGCLAGSCGACKIEVNAGAKNLSIPGAVELDTLSHFKDGDKIFRLACRAKVLGDVSISY
jgi:ferredoxin